MVAQAGTKITNCFVRPGDSKESRRILRGQYLPNAAGRAEPIGVNLFGPGEFLDTSSLSRWFARGSHRRSREGIVGAFQRDPINETPDSMFKLLIFGRIGFLKKNMFPFHGGW